MIKLLFSLGLIILGISVGQGIRFLAKNKMQNHSLLIDKRIRNTQNLVILGINPFITMTAFWILKITDLKIVALPFIGSAALVIGGVLALAGSKVLGHDRRKTGAMFSCGSLTNLGSFGGLICFIFLGEISYPFVSMYILFRDFVYYGIAFPIAKLFGDTNINDKPKDKSIIKFFSDPFIMIPLTGIVLGCSLNISGIVRPGVFSGINEVLIPLDSFLLVVTVGYYMKLTIVGSYIKESLITALIKFLIVPASITTASYLLGLGDLYNGLILKVILIMSSMPPAFNSLIPPQLYGLDLDLANSVWLLNTGALVIVLPVIYNIQLLLF